MVIVGGVLLLARTTGISPNQLIKYFIQSIVRIMIHSEWFFKFIKLID